MASPTELEHAIVASSNISAERAAYVVLGFGKPSDLLASMPKWLEDLP